MRPQRYHTSLCPERDETCFDDAIQEAMNDRFGETFTLCECCGAYTPRTQAVHNPWFDTLCPRCHTARPCDRCGAPLPLHRLAQQDGEYYCTRCMPVQAGSTAIPCPPLNNETL